MINIHLFDLVEKTEAETPPVQTPSFNLVYLLSLPSTPPDSGVAPYYYPVPVHYNVIYPYHIPPALFNSLIRFPCKLNKCMRENNAYLSILRNRYTLSMGICYPPDDIDAYPHYHPLPPSHQMLLNLYIPTNGYNMPGFSSHPNAPITSVSTFIAYHQAKSQPISTTLSEDEFDT